MEGERQTDREAGRGREKKRRQTVTLSNG